MLFSKRGENRQINTIVIRHYYSICERKRDRNRERERERENACFSLQLAVLLIIISIVERNDGVIFKIKSLENLSNVKVMK